MVTENEKVDVNLVYQHILSLQQDVTIKFADLSKQVTDLMTFVAVDKDRNLTAKIEDQRKRIEVLEHALTGAKAFGWFASGLSLALTIWMAFKEILGK